MASAAVHPNFPCAVLLAAGQGRRFVVDADVTAADHGQPRAASHKLLADLRGKAVYQWALEAVLAAEPEHIVVITGAAALDLPPGVIEVHNAHWADGQATSLQHGLRAAAELGAERVVVGLADQPFVTPDSWRAVAATDAPIAVATYGGSRGNPVGLHRSVWELLPTDGDQGARSLITQRPELVREVACNGSPADIDTMEDLQQWNSSTNSP